MRLPVSAPDKSPVPVRKPATVRPLIRRPPPARTFHETDEPGMDAFVNPMKSTVPPPPMPETWDGGDGMPEEMNEPQMGGQGGPSGPSGPSEGY
jgi:hypothetical protein